MFKLFLLLSTVKMMALASSPGAKSAAQAQYSSPDVKSSAARYDAMAILGSPDAKSAARAQYDAMAMLVSNNPYPSIW